MQSSTSFGHLFVSSLLLQPCKLFVLWCSHYQKTHSYCASAWQHELSSSSSSISLFPGKASFPFSLGTRLRVFWWHPHTCCSEDGSAICPATSGHRWRTTWKRHREPLQVTAASNTTGSGQDTPLSEYLLQASNTGATACSCVCLLECFACGD